MARKKIKTAKEIEEEFDAIIDKRLNARNRNLKQVLIDTEEGFKNATDNYLSSVYAKNGSPNNLTDEDKLSVKKSIDKQFKTGD